MAKPLTKAQLNKITDKIKDFNEEEKRAFFHLIYNFAIQQDSKNENKIPFKGKQIGDDLTFDIKNIPIELQHQLYDFVKSI